MNLIRSRLLPSLCTSGWMGILLWGASLPLAAQTYEIGVTGGLSRISSAVLGSLNFDDPLAEDSRLRGKNLFGARVTWNTRGYYGHELGYLRNAAKFQTDILNTETDTRSRQEHSLQIHQVFYNFLAYFMPAGERWRPFVTGGAQMHEFGRPKIDGFPSGLNRKFGANWGGGIKLAPAKNALVRLDFRDYITGKPYGLTYPSASSLGELSKEGGVLHVYEASVGFSITF